MTTDTPAAHESVVSTKSIETIDDRSIRALTDKMTVLPMGGDVYEVVSESGNSYRVDSRRDICDCPDYEYRDDIDRCKHVRRVAYAEDETTVPPWVDRNAVDPQLGEHTDSEGPRFANEQLAVADGGSALEQSADGDTSVDGDDEDGCECEELPTGFPCFSCFMDGAKFEEGV